MENKYKYLILFLTIWINTFAMNVTYPNKYEIEVQLLDKEKLLKVIKNNNGVVVDSLYKKLTARTYLIDSGKFVIEFFDHQGILVSDRTDLKNLDEVNFIKNKVGFLKQRISYYVKINDIEADKLISELNGKQLAKYKTEFNGLFAFKVYQLDNGQVIIKYDENSYLYEDLEALAFENDQILHIHYPDGWESGKADFIKGKLSGNFNIDDYMVYPQEAKKIIKSHELTIIKDKIIFDHPFKSILYQSQTGYFILMEDFDQLNVGGNAKIGIGNARVFKTIKEFEKKYQKKLDWRKRIEANPELLKGKHIYKELSDKYGKDFPNKTFEEINVLPSILNFDTTRLEFSVECAEILSESIKWNYGGETFFNEIIYPILAYVGEYNKFKGVGNWSMLLDRKGEVWEPRFADIEGKEVFDIIDFYKIFHEAEYGIPRVEYFLN